MASVYDLKPRFQNLLRPLCGALARAGISAHILQRLGRECRAFSVLAGGWVALYTVYFTLRGAAR